MKKCRYCRIFFEDKYNFCLECGKPLTDGNIRRFGADEGKGKRFSGRPFHPNDSRHDDVPETYEEPEDFFAEDTADDISDDDEVYVDLEFVGDGSDEDDFDDEEYDDEELEDEEYDEDDFEDEEYDDEELEDAEYDEEYDEEEYDDEEYDEEEYDDMESDDEESAFLWSLKLIKAIILGVLIFVLIFLFTKIRYGI